MADASLSIGGRTYRVTCRDGGEAHLREVAQLLDAELEKALEEAPKDKPLVFFCHHGGRSQRAAEQFVSRGFKKVYNVVGGIDAWSQSVDPSVARSRRSMAISSSKASTESKAR